MFDLHMHSLASDGLASFETVCRRLAESPQLELVALTDHDAIIDSTLLARIEPRAWIGTELTTKTDGKTIDLLALNVRPDHDPLNNYLVQRKRDRVLRFDAYGEALRAEGWQFEPPASVYDNPQLAQPHVVRELRRHAANIARLVDMGIPGEWRTRADDDRIFSEILRPLDIQVGSILSTAEAIALTHEAGGIAVVAHPWIEPYNFGERGRDEARSTLAAFAAAGLDGLELFHESQTDPEVRAEIAGVAASHGLVVTAGCDDHTEQLENLATLLPATDPRAAGWLNDIRERAARYR